LFFYSDGEISADSAGRFRLDRLAPGRYRIWRSKAPPSSGAYLRLDSQEVVVLPGQSVEHDIVRPIGRTISGKTVDLDRKPLGSCAVKICRHRKDREDVDIQESGPDGAFRIENVPAGDLVFSAEHHTVLGIGSAKSVEEIDLRGSTNVKADASTVVIQLRATSKDDQSKVSPDFADESGSRDKKGEVSLLIGSMAPSLKAWPLDGGPAVEWQPDKRGDTLIVFCSFWRPQDRAFLAKAAAWVSQRKFRMTVFSTDWCLEQVRRERTKVVFQGDVLFAGPGGIEAAKLWRYGAAARCYLVGPDRRVVHAPGTFELP
jgi:hypothetical protein